jgi:hypothetical protein
VLLSPSTLTCNRATPSFHDPEPESESRAFSHFSTCRPPPFHPLPHQRIPSWAPSFLSLANYLTLLVLLVRVLPRVGIQLVIEIRNILVRLFCTQHVRRGRRLQTHHACVQGIVAQINQRQHITCFRTQRQSYANSRKPRTEPAKHTCDLM